MFNDLKYGLRVLLKKPGFTLIAVLSLALGIGANTAIFSLLDAVLLKSLPVQQPDRLVLFGNGQSMGVTNDFPSESCDLFSYPFYRQVQQRDDLFSGVASQLSIQWNVHGFVNGHVSSDIEQFQVQLVSGSYFPVLGVNPYVGRVLNEADDQTVGAHPVAVVSHAWWTRRLGQDPNAVGKTVTIDDVAYTIVGVAPREFFGTTVGNAPDMWVPLAMEKQLPPAHWDGRNSESFQSLFVIGRLKDGVSPEQASAAVNLLFKQSLAARAGRVVVVVVAVPAGPPLVVVVVLEVRTGSFTNFTLSSVSITSCSPMPRKPPAPITTPLILPSFVTRISLMSPIFSFWAL